MDQECKLTIFGRMYRKAIKLIGVCLLCVGLVSLVVWTIEKWLT